MSTINELKAMNQKELCVWSSKVNAKELKAILKNNGFRGYSKMKKAELLNAVLDMIIADKVEVINNVEVVNNEADNIPSTMFIDEIEDINVQQEIESGLKTTLKVDALFSAFHDGPKKTEDEYIKNEIESQKKEYNTKIKDVKENKDLNRVADELNKCFVQLNSGLRAEVITTRTGNYIRNNLYIYAKGVCLECYDYDFYSTKLDKFVSENGENEDSWFDEVYDTDDGDRLCQRDLCKEENKLDILYIYGLDDDRLELPLNVEPLECSLIEYRFNLLNDKNVDVDMSCKDWFDVTSESGWIRYGIEVDELLAINRARKGQKTNFVYMSEKAMNDLYDKASIALIEVNNIKLLK